MVTLVEMLLKANPEDIEWANFCDIVCHLCKHTKGDLFMSLIVLFLTANKGALKGLDSKLVTLLTFRTVASRSLADLKYLLEFHLASTVNNNGCSNILHYAMCDNMNDIAIVEEKVKYICRQYPSLVLQHDIDGYTPLLYALYNLNMQGCQRFMSSQ